MNLPNFIIGGGVATGTSFLSHAIKDHSEIYLPKVMRPECGFFYKSWEYSKGLEYYSNKWFADAGEQKAKGERSSLYLHGDFLRVAERIHKHIPNIKLIFCLRNPTERAYANYRFSVLSGYEKFSFEKALSREDKRFAQAKGWKKEIQPNLYRRRGLYDVQLRPFLDFFPKENIHLIKSESLSANTELEIKKLFDFLGVEFQNYNLAQKFTSYSVKSRILQTQLRKFYGEKLTKVTENARQVSYENSIADKIVNWNLLNEKTPMTDSVRSHLNEYYAESNQFVSKITGWDLTDWA